MFNKRLLKEFADNNKKVVGIVACQCIILIANIIFTLFTTNILYCLCLQNFENINILNYLLVAGIVIVIRVIANTIMSKLSFETATNIKSKLRNMIYDKLFDIGSAYKQAIMTSEAVQISTEGVEQLEIYFSKYIPQFFYSMIAPLILFAVVGTMSLKTALVLFVCVPLIPMSIVAVQKFAKKMLSKYWGTYTEMGDNFLESLQGLTTLKIYNADEEYAVKMDEEAEQFRKITMRVLIMQLNSISVMDLVAYGGAGLGIILSILELRCGNIDFAQCFFIIMISAEFFLPMRLLGSYFHIAMNGNAAADKIFKFIDEEDFSNIIKDTKNLENVSDSDRLLKFDKVRFGYDDSKTVLDDITFEVKKGSFTSIVGMSGCGKSTIATLIMGEYKKYKGNILIDGIDNKEYVETDRFAKITRVNHNSYLFKGTVRDNLIMARKDASDKDMLEVLKKVDLYDLVMQNGGLDMKISERATNISGGQKQRFAVARAMLKESDIYIFDEATSNVDATSEDKIMEVINELAKKKTVILISHRLFNVINSDNILVMNDGKIVESGTHEELMQFNNYYANLFNTQKELELYAKGVN